MRTGYLGLGSNVGDREAHLRAAIDALEAAGVEVEAVSSAYETEPVGEVLDQPDFLNAADPDPHRVWSRRSCSTSARRSRPPAAGGLDAPRHSPRPLDVDLLLLGDLELATDRLTLPHREVTSRRFVLVPLLELDPRARAAGRDAARRRARRRSARANGSSGAARSSVPSRRPRLPIQSSVSVARTAPVAFVEAVDLDRRLVAAQSDMPLAWLRLRRSPAWLELPAGVRQDRRARRAPPSLGRPSLRCSSPGWR